MKEKNINQNRTLKNIKKAFPYYIMLLPGFIYLIINNYIPMAGVVIAFKTWISGKVFSEVTGLALKILNICLRHRMHF